MSLTVDDIMRATLSSRLDAVKFGDYLLDAMDRFHIDNPRRHSGFLSTVSIESDKLASVEESLYYKDPARLCAIFPRIFATETEAAKYTRNPAKLSQILYHGFHGRGLIQLSFEKNYARAGLALGVDFIGQPELLLQPKHAAMSAAWFWDDAACNQAADRGDMRDVTRRVNGPALMKLKERTDLFEKNMTWMPA